MILAKQILVIDYLYYQINKEAIKLNKFWNNYFNNDLYIYKNVKLYRTLCYATKNRYLELFRYTMREVIIILSTLAILKLKYGRVILK